MNSRAGVDVEVSRPDGTRFEMRDKNLPWVRDVYPASGGWTVRVLPPRDRESQDRPPGRQRESR